jgi:hypothetical protein
MRIPFKFSALKRQSKSNSLLNDISIQVVLLQFSLISSYELLNDYYNVIAPNDMRSLFFRFGPLSVSFPVLREKIENRILKDFFIRTFNLPEEFNFAMYTCGALKSYVISLSELRPLNWYVSRILSTEVY